MKYYLLLCLISSSLAIKLRDGDETADADLSENPEADKKKEEERKFAEVNALMSKYDQAEAHIKWINSPEFAKQ